ncbi:MAG: sugar ABC transporter substrate-binding protein [Leptolyngbyaceae cyanobacterium RU_5_1]|nr:sugar ABC transporter substrate-binding protein [Leptolyngbyaceae cyanobacterium RU_5_1]
MNDFDQAYPFLPIWRNQRTYASQTHSSDSSRLNRLSRTLIFPALIWTALMAPAIAQAPKPAPVPQQPASQIPQDDGYLLGPGDRLKIDLFNLPEFSGEYQVLPNGAVNLPIIGEVSVQGKTLKQASATISTKYAAFLKRPTATLNLVSARPIRIAIAGEVNRPGSYTILSTSVAEGNVATITRTIQLAEGITQAADLRKVQIRRSRSLGGGADQVFTVDLWQLLKGADLKQDLRLRDGDSIFIPAQTSIDLAEAQQLAAANFAARNNRPLKITVVGEVNRPGPYTLLEGAVSQRDQLINPNLLQLPSVTRAIQVAGGITQLADVRNIQVRRLTRSGPPQLIKLDFWKLLKAGDVLQDLPLQDGDTIEIPTATALNDRETTELATASFSPDQITVNVAGEVDRPGSVTLRPNSPLNQAILAAGGFTQKSVKRSVTLVRLNANGSVTKRDVSIDFAQGVNEQGNPALRNNDIVIVRKTGFASFLDGAGAFLGPFNGIVNFFRIF